MSTALRGLLIAVFAAAVVAALLPYWHATAMILRAAGTPGWLGRAARWDARAVTESVERIPTPEGTIRIRIFRSAGATRAVQLVSGVHPDGIEEPRLIDLARDLAGTGVNVATPEIPDLMQYRLTARVTDTIEHAALWLAGRPDLSGSGRVGMIGVSFSGGLSVVAAGRPALRDHVAYVLSFGGHGNLPRVLRYYCTGVEPALSGAGDTQRPPTTTRSRCCYTRLPIWRCRQNRRNPCDAAWRRFCRRRRSRASIRSGRSKSSPPAARSRSSSLNRPQP